MDLVKLERMAWPDFNVKEGIAVNVKQRGKWKTR